MATAAAPRPEYLSPDEDEEVVTEGGTLSALEEADRSHQVATAKRFPRSLTQFRKELAEIAQMNPHVAQEMMYSLPRAGKQLVGPSIRFAEAALSAYGNARAGVEVVDVQRTEDGCWVVAEGRFYDCEKNVGIAIRTRRRVVAKTINADAIQVTGVAASSIALRNSILRGVPKALWADLFEKAKATAVGEIKSIAEVIDRLFAVITKMGVTETMIFNALNIAGKDDVGADQIIAMQSWQNQLSAGESTIEDIFGSPDDVEIERLMNALGWNDTKKRLSAQSFRGRRSEHLQYLREEAQKAGVEVAVKQQAERPKAEPKPAPESLAELHQQRRESAREAQQQPEEDTTHSTSSQSKTTSTSTTGMNAAATNGTARRRVSADF